MVTQEVCDGPIWIFLVAKMVLQIIYIFFLIYSYTAFHLDHHNSKIASVHMCLLICWICQ